MHQYLVDKCPYLPDPLRKVAFNVLEEAEGQTIQSHGQKSQINTGTVIHKFGRMDKGPSILNYDNFEDTEPVIFLSIPYLAFSEAQAADSHREEKNYRSLLKFIYGRDVEDLQQTHIHPLIDGTARANDWPSIEVPETEFLLIGSGNSCRPSRGMPIVTDDRYAYKHFQGAIAKCPVDHYLHQACGARIPTLYCQDSYKPLSAFVPSTHQARLQP